MAPDSDDGNRTQPPPADGETHAFVPSRADATTTTPGGHGAARGASHGGASPGAGGGGRRQKRQFADGELVGRRYRITRFVARGGMGEVYEAEDTQIGGRVALKTILPDSADDDIAVDRFKRELYVARKVTSRNACRLHDIGEHYASDDPAEPPTLFLTMEFLEGPTLSQKLQRGPLDFSEALVIAEQLAQGLEAAHEVGVLHRDFKSANIVLCASPGRSGIRVVITDFGLARGFLSGQSLTSITGTGAFTGTPAYMAPEQVEASKNLTPAADIYALGIVLYEMVTGVRPFDGDSAFRVALRRLHERPASPRNHRADLDPRWEAVILRCLRRRPQARFERATDVIEALRGADVPDPQGDAEPPPSPMAVAALAALGGQADAGTTLPPETIATPPGGVTLPPPPPAAAPAAPAPWASEPLPAAAPVAARWRGRRAWAALAVIGLVLLVGFALRYRDDAPVESAAAQPTMAMRPLIAVLPPRSSNGQDEWIGLAVAELAGHALEQAGKVRVTPGDEVSAALREAGPRQDEARHAQRMALWTGAEKVVTGQFTPIDGGLLQLELVAREGNAVLASGRASGSRGQLADLTARALGPLREKLGLGPESPAAAASLAVLLPASSEVARNLIEGQAAWSVRGPVAARPLLEAAASADRQHPLAPAWAALANARLGLAPQAKALAGEARARLSNIPEASRPPVLALVLEAEGEWGAAADVFHARVKAFPDDTRALAELVRILTAAGRAREAQAVAETALAAGLKPDPELLVTQARMAQDLGDLQATRRHAAEAARLARAREARWWLAQARMLEAAAAEALGDARGADLANEEARRAFEALDDRAWLSKTLSQMAGALVARGDLAGGAAMFSRALELQQALGDVVSAARLQHNLGTVLIRQGEVAEAERNYEAAFSVFRARGLGYEHVRALSDLGAARHRRGDLAAALERYQAAHDLAGRIGDRPGTAMTLTNLGEVFFDRGQLAEALQMHREGLAINRELGDKAGAGYDLRRLGETFRVQGDDAVAKQRYDEALALFVGLGDRVSAAEVKLGLARLSLVIGDAPSAKKLAGEAEQVLRTEGVTDTAAVAQLVLARADLAGGSTAAARSALDRARTSLATDDPRPGLEAAIVEFLVATAEGRGAESRGLDAAKQARARGLVVLEFEARLAMVEARAKSEAGKAAARTLQAEAERQGLGAIARRAAALGAS